MVLQKNAKIGAVSGFFWSIEGEVIETIAGMSRLAVMGENADLQDNWYMRPFNRGRLSSFSPAAEPNQKMALYLFFSASGQALPYAPIFWLLSSPTVLSFPQLLPQLASTCSSRFFL